MRLIGLLFKVRLILIFVVSLILLPKLNAAGATTGSFLLVNIDARETALGGIFSPYYARPGAASVNPACLQGIKNKYIAFSHYSSVFSSHYEQIEYAQPLNVSSAAAVSFMYSTIDDLSRTDSTGEVLERIDNYDAVLGLSYSFVINEQFNAGINLKFVTEKIYNTVNMGGTINLGLLYRNFDSRYTIGADIENLGLSTSYFKDKSLYPMLCRAGCGMEVYRFEEKYKISLFMEERIFLLEQDNTETSIGLEAAYEKFFTFRYGYTLGKTDGRVAVGAGVRLSDMFIDYAYQPYFISDNAHRITIKYMF